MSFYWDNGLWNKVNLGHNRQFIVALARLRALRKLGIRRIDKRPIPNMPDGSLGKNHAKAPA